MSTTRSIVAAVGLASACAGSPGQAIAGQPVPGATPSAKEFQIALDRFMAQRGPNYYSLHCVSLIPDPPAERSGSFKDTRYDHSPAGYRLSTEKLVDPGGNRKAQLEYLKNEGFLESRPNPNGGIDYQMTWKGFAASNGNGCLFIHDWQHQARIGEIIPKPAANGARLYEVRAAALPKNPAPWTQTDRFGQLFPSHASILQGEKPHFVNYELELRNKALVVVKVNGRDHHETNSTAVAEGIRQFGAITADQVKATVTAYLDSRLNASSAAKPCLRLPAPNEVDRMALETTSATLDLFHLPVRPEDDKANKLRGYNWLRRLETLGLVRARPLDTVEFGGQAAVGGIRFEVTRTGAEWFAPNLTGCKPLGTYQLEEILAFEQLSPGTNHSRFAARLSIRPADGDTRRALAEFGHFSRAVEVGVPLVGSLTLRDGRLQVSSASPRLPGFMPSADTPGIAATPQNIEVHSVRVYNGTVPQESRRAGYGPPVEGSVRVNLFKTPKPVGLFLTANDPVHWIIELKPGARLVRVITSSSHPQRVSFINAKGVAISSTPYIGGDPRPPLPAERAFGIKPTTNHYQYTGTSFDVGPP